MIKRLIVAVLLVLATGCTATSLPPSNTPELVEPAPLGPVQQPDPRELRVPRLGITTALVPLGVEADGSHEVPPVTSPMTAGWFKAGPEPGEKGAAIILGHVNGGGHDGIFRHLTDMKVGDEIGVDNKTFTVYEVQTVAKSKFPSYKVYEAEGTELRLITCGGAFDSGADSYVDNIIVYARSNA